MVESGIIGTDGKLRIPMDRLNEFFKRNAGKRVIARFETVEPGTTEAQFGYLKSYVIPTIAEALRQTGTLYTEAELERQLLEWYPRTLRNVSGEEIVSLSELSQLQMSDFLDWVKQFAAEELLVYIENPRTI